MLIEMIVRLLGGFWGLKWRCNQSSPMKRFYLLIYRIHQFYHSASIGYNSHFKGIPVLPHGINGIFISGEAKIGRDCVIFQQVTIGSNSLPDSKRMGAPIIGDCCYIGAGAKVIGRVKVGNNVRIGANAVVYKDVPDNSVVIFSSQTMIKRGTPPNNRFYTFRAGRRWCYVADGKFVEEKDHRVIKRLQTIRKKPADSL